MPSFPLLNLLEEILKFIKCGAEYGANNAYKIMVFLYSVYAFKRRLGGF